MVDFRRSKNPKEPLVITDESVEIFDSINVIGTIITSDLKWDENIQSIFRQKINSACFFWRRVQKFGGQQEDIMSYTAWLMTSARVPL